jgi:chaperone BCS1
VRVLKMHTLQSSRAYGEIKWESVNLEHPATFETLAMEPDLKNIVIEDLNRFVRRKEFYKRVGRAWKRGYLLYGPPGTGKSSLVAAMANYLRFDVYDLQLANIMRDSDLRKLLLATGNRSILVIEDIDCSVDLPDRRQVRGDGDGRKQHDVQVFFPAVNFVFYLVFPKGEVHIILSFLPYLLSSKILVMLFFFYPIKPTSPPLPKYYRHYWYYHLNYPNIS